ncbi:Hypothetical predicted protein [Olea europaea subsp. europaea]|uniref:Uncharacterized protein n=1 Tax=Olea europaea subsp. europaea TaxID=158383 RepID=A0A8S0TY75_OLEEU|nr:Hypothetical predicted protein [Olea europaea subsp. europaea]
MADNEDRTETAPKGNEWEVISLTAPANAASPGLKEVESSEDSQRYEKENKGDIPYLIAEERGKLDVKDEEKVSIEQLMSDEFPGVHDFDEKDNRLSVGEFSTFHNISTMGRSYAVEEDAMADDMAEPFEHDLHLNSPSFQKPVKENKYGGADLPCEAWWKMRALSLYDHVKEANTFSSIIIATTIIGLVIIGHKWKKEKVATFSA